VKCHFDATVDDVKTAFADFQFSHIENYNPGSFSLEFSSKESAKAFVESTRNTVKKRFLMHIIENYGKRVLG
jgi:hypothetical protein